MSLLVRDELLGEEPKPPQLRELAAAALPRRIARTLDDAVSAGSPGAYIVGPLEVLPALLPRFEQQTASAWAAPRRGRTSIPCIVQPPASSVRRSSRRRTITSASSPRAWRRLVGPRDRSSCVAPLVARPPGGVREQRARAYARGTPGRGSGRSAGRHTRSRRATWRRGPRVQVLAHPGRASARRGMRLLQRVRGRRLRVVPSLDFVSARLRLTPLSAKARVVARRVAVDPLIPPHRARDAALGPRMTGRELLVLDAIRPRLDLQFSVPSFSRHLFPDGRLRCPGGGAYRTGPG